MDVTATVANVGKEIREQHDDSLDVDGDDDGVVAVTVLMVGVLCN